MKFFSLKFYIRIFWLAYKELEAIIFGRIQEVSIHNHTDIKIKKIYPANNFHMPPLRDIDGNQNVTSYNATVPQANVLTVNNGFFIPGREEIYTSDFKVLKEITVQKKNPQTGKSKKKLLKYKKLNGRVLSLSLNGVERNYFHFTIENLARWHLFKMSGLDYDYIDFDKSNKFLKQYIDIIGIPKEKLIPESYYKGAIKADLLIVPGLINNWEYFEMPHGKLHYMKQHIPNWFNKVHEVFRNKSEVSERIYVSRAKADRRRIVNEKDVINLVTKYGFNVYNMEDLSVNEQISLFNKAEIVIVTNGAAAANLVYCSNPFTFLEIFPQNYFDSNLRILAQVLKCEYHYVIAKCPQNTDTDPQKEDLYLDCKKLEKWLIKFAAVDEVKNYLYKSNETKSS